MLTLAASAWLYAASVSWFHASPRRTWLASLKRSSKQRRLVQTGGAVAAALALFALHVEHGLEMAIAYWLGLIMLAAVLSLLISALRPGAHLASMIFALAVSLIALAAGMILSQAAG